MRAAAVTAGLLLLVSAIPVAEAQEPAPRIRIGTNVAGIAPLAAAGAPPDLAMFWLGAWNNADPYGPAVNWLRETRDAGVTPVIQYWYWGDSISPNCVKYGCDGRDMQEWTAALHRLAQAITDTMGGRETIVVLEPEFNKDGIEKWEEWDGIWAEKARILKAAPGAKVVLSFGNWGREDWPRFDRAVAEADLLGFQTMRGSTRNSLTSYLDAPDAIAAAAKEIQTKFGRPSLLTDLALSSYPEPEYLEHQRATIAEVLRRTPEYAGYGLTGIVYRGLKDAPGMDLDNYFGYAERHWGLWWAYNNTPKPAFEPWLAYAKANAATPSPPPVAPGFDAPGAVEAETLPATTGARSTDAAASAGYAWNLWANGDLKARVTSPGATYDLVVRARGDVAGGAAPRMEVRLDGTLLRAFDVPAGYADYVVRADLPAGDRTLTVRFTNDWRDATSDRNLIVDRVEARAPASPAQARLAAPLTAPAEVVANATFRASYVVENVGGETLRETFGFAVGGQARGAAPLVLAPGARATVAVDLALPAGTYTLEARMGGDLARAVPGDGGAASVRVLRAGAAEMASALSAPSRVVAGETFTATWSVRNAGESTLQQTFALAAEGRLWGARQVTLAPGATAAFSAALALRNAGDAVLAVRMGADGAAAVPGAGSTATVSVARAGEARLAAPLAAPAEVAAGAGFTASYRVTNVGDAPVTATYGVHAANRLWGARELTLAPGETREVAATVSLEAGTWTLEARTGDGAAVPGDGGRATVTARAAFAATFAPKPGNEWWIEVRVDANAPLAGVTASVNGGAPKALEHRWWGSWTGSMHAPAGSKVVFTATSASGDKVVSGAYRWPDATAWTEPEPAPAPAPAPTPAPWAWTKEAESAATKTTGAKSTDGAASGGAAWNLWANGYLKDSFQAPASGSYQVSVVAKGTSLGGVQAAFDLVVDGKVVASYTATSSYKEYTKTVKLGAGWHEVRVVFKNDARSSTEDRNLLVDKLGAASS